MNAEPDWEALRKSSLQQQRWERDRYVRQAARLGVRLVDELDPEEFRGVHLVYRSPRTTLLGVHVSRYPRDWRIQEVSEPGLYHRSWRWPLAGFERMLRALVTWDGDPNTEPTGYTTRIDPDPNTFEMYRALARGLSGLPDAN